MATVDIMGPFVYDLGSPGLAYQQAYNVWVGPSDLFKPPATITVTGFGSSGTAGEHNLWVSDMSTSVRGIRMGDIILTNYFIYATFFNSGVKPIRYITAYISVVRR